MIYKTLKPLVLASNSPRRRDYLGELGLEFTIHAEAVDETPGRGEKCVPYVERIARAKARVVRDLYPDRYILAADTAVCLEEKILGKPGSTDEAVKTLTDLAGKEHKVSSGICICSAEQNLEIVNSITTIVSFTDFDEATARSYVALGESLDKAGSYGIQGKGAFLVSKVQGSYTNVVGLPLAEVVAILIEHRVICNAT